MSAGLDAAAIVRVLRAAHLHDASRRALLQTACDRIRAWGAHSPRRGR